MGFRGCVVGGVWVEAALLWGGRLGGGFQEVNGGRGWGLGLCVPGRAIHK